MLSPVLPPGAATEALSDVVYFAAAAATGPLLVLTAWLVGSVLVITAATALHRQPTSGVPGEPVRTAAHPATEDMSSPPAGQPAVPQDGDRDD